MKKRIKQFGKATLAMVCLVSVAAIAVPLWTHEARQAALVASNPSLVDISETDSAERDSAERDAAERDGAVLRVMTLNLAHGRSDGRHQALRKRSAIVSNLDDVGEVLNREHPDVVALQEADGPSVWSGNFNHVEYLAENGRFPHSCRGEHVQGMKLSYGTALLSRLPLTDCDSTTFAPSPPTLSKGFVIGTISWPDKPGMAVDIVSVHLDFSRKNVQQRQIRKMIDLLGKRKNPLIVMGDFNCHWKDDDSPLRTLAEELGLYAYEPSKGKMVTFPKLKRRLDWILVSKPLEFARYETVPDTISDHLGVVAELQIATSEK